MGDGHVSGEFGGASGDEDDRPEQMDGGCDLHGENPPGEDGGGSAEAESGGYVPSEGSDAGDTTPVEILTAMSVLTPKRNCCAAARSAKKISATTACRSATCVVNCIARTARRICHPAESKPVQGVGTRAVVGMVAISRVIGQPLTWRAIMGALLVNRTDVVDRQRRNSATSPVLLARESR
ncbi:unnamed protein product [Ectocarpus sp. 4 AP-2014]